jgi:MoxR-like ATPase
VRSVRESPDQALSTPLTWPGLIIIKIEVEIGGKMNAVDRIKRIGIDARSVFIGRDSLIRAIELGVVSGEHVIVLGPPGTGKSACIRYFAKAMGLSFFRRVLNPDLPREDLVGPINPMALKDGKWERSWSGLATASIAFLDEIGKASSQVQNIFLDAMEERRVTSGNIDREIPLHLVMAASNETIDSDSPAIWDRFTIRLTVERLSETRDFVKLLEDAWGAMSPPSIIIQPEELSDLRARCLKMASEAVHEPSVRGLMVKLWKGSQDVLSSPASDRRWLRLLVIAAANALLNDRDAIAVVDLDVAKFVLWYDLDDIEAVTQFIDETIDEEKKEVMAAEAMIESMDNTLVKINETGGVSISGNMENAARLLYRAGQLQNELSRRIGENGSSSEWTGLFDRLTSIVDSVNSQMSE